MCVYLKFNKDNGNSKHLIQDHLKTIKSLTTALNHSGYETSLAQSDGTLKVYQDH